MTKRTKFISSRFVSRETGQALVLVLIFVLLGSLTLLPVLAHISTALKSGVIYENKTNELYAADAGIEDSMWRVKYDFMGPSYDPYDFSTVWSYQTDPVNGLTADITIQNVWLPSNVDPPAPALGRAIIESEKLVVTGTSGGSPGQPYHIKVEFTPAASDNLTVKSLGIWLPQGFTYEGPSNLEEDFSDDYYPDSVQESIVPGGTTVVWSYNPAYPLFTSFPGVDPEDLTMTTEITFTYNPPADNPDELPVAVAWITTDAVADVPIAWDTDSRIYKVTSTAGDTHIEAYSTKCELRKLGDAIAGDYVAIGNSMLADDNSDHIRETWHTPSNYTLTTIPADGDVIAAYLYWSGWRNDAAKISVFSDTCSALTNWDCGSPTAWSVASSSYFKGHYLSGGTPAKLLTIKNAQNLSSYVPGSVMVTWEQSSPIPLYDTCSSITTNWENGAAWTDSSGHFRARSNSGISDPARLLTLKVGQDLSYTTLETVTVSWDQWENATLGTGDGLDFAFSSDNGVTWGTNLPAFRDDIGNTPQNFSYPIPSAYLTSGFKMRFQVVGCNLTGGSYIYIDDIKITPSYSSSDGLDFAISGDGGATWSDNIEAFRGDIGSSAVQYDYYIPAAYDTSTFKIRFQLVGMDGPGEMIKLDNIKIIDLPPDTSITFKINDQQVYLDANGDPQADAQPLTSERSYAMANYLGGSTQGFSYASIRDVSKLVKKYPVVPGELHHTGNTKYTVDAVSADLGSNFTFAGWSLIIIYGSPQTAGHYLYLWDNNFAYHPGTGGSLDFDNDGLPGGIITNFIVPEPIKNKYGVVIETVAARLTCFVVEGDLWLQGDSVTVTGQQSLLYKLLSNTQSPTNNAWNGLWPYEAGTTVYEGVDIDTYEILWADNILTPKDTSLTVDLESSNDSWNLVYLILSVRSETVTRGTEHYVISSY